ncbi:MAG: carbohydrate ABC transporter permease [Clostridiales bacterium]|jgi:putative aldouronate transport system permease protein|nr:carbohydrate ABC transporter permease [Clostridiales bacterium]
MDIANKVNLKPEKPKKPKRLNAISLPAEAAIHIIIGLFALCCVIPFIFVIIISFTSQESLQQMGYSFFPASWDTTSYDAAFKLGDQLWRSYFNSFVVTVIGTAASVLICMLYSYGMFRKDYKFRKFFTFFAFFTMMFGGGLAPTVMVTRSVLGLSESYGALIVPLLVSPFNFIVMRTFFKTAIPDSLIEASFLDGSGEFRTIFSIVMPIAKPGIATIALLNAVSYWNDWYLALLYVHDRLLYPLQFLLMEMQRNIEFITRNSAMMSAGTVNFAELPSEGLRMALCVFIVLPIACAYPFFQRYIIAGLTLGAVKE